MGDSRNIKRNCYFPLTCASLVTFKWTHSWACATNSTVSLILHWSRKIKRRRKRSAFLLLLVSHVPFFVTDELYTYTATASRVERYPLSHEDTQMSRRATTTFSNGRRKINPMLPPHLRCHKESPLLNSHLLIIPWPLVRSIDRSIVFPPLYIGLREEEIVNRPRLFCSFENWPFAFLTRRTEGLSPGLLLHHNRRVLCRFGCREKNNWNPPSESEQPFASFLIVDVGRCPWCDANLLLLPPLLNIATLQQQQQLAYSSSCALLLQHQRKTGCRMPCRWYRPSVRPSVRSWIKLPAEGPLKLLGDDHQARIRPDQAVVYSSFQRKKEKDRTHKILIVMIIITATSELRRDLVEGLTLSLNGVCVLAKVFKTKKKKKTINDS